MTVIPLKERKIKSNLSIHHFLDIFWDIFYALVGYFELEIYYTKNKIQQSSFAGSACPSVRPSIFSR